jgi:hypothetical protein
LPARLIAGFLLLLGASFAAADDIKAPKISVLPVQWDAALAALNNAEAAAKLPPSPDKTANALARLNGATGADFPNIAASPVPVLLPFDLDAYLRRKAGEDAGYLSGFAAPKFFLAGPAGYDAAFSVPRGDAKRDAEIHISGLALLYELDERVGGEEKPPVGLQADFPGIRRFYFESHMRYLFTRYGVLYDVSIECFDGSARIKLLSCQEAHAIASRFLKALAIAGGKPQPIPASVASPAKTRPEKRAAAFSYYPPGQLISGTGARKRGGDPDYTVYSAIRFPLADAPVQTYSQMFMNLGDCTAASGDSQTLRRRGAPFRCGLNNKVAEAAMPSGGQNLYPWRDNFCEARGFFVGQCPSGLGHQGQDIVPVECGLSSQDSDHCDRSQHRVVAVRDGMVMRAPRQEGLVVVVNEPGAHLRFRYLHMNPKIIDDAGFFSGRVVRQGEIVGRVGNYNGREGGTSYHLHFDMQVPTKDGWVLVNPYMTLVSSYERLIGGRGMEIHEDIEQASSDIADIAEMASIRDKAKIAGSSARKKLRKHRRAAHTKHYRM